VLGVLLDRRKPRRNRNAPDRNPLYSTHPRLDAFPFGPYVVGVESTDVLVVVTTVGTEEQALDIAQELVRRRLAACVNILPAVRSVFRWKGTVNDDTELLLLVKTVAARLPAVRDVMKELNAYELPEILAFPAAFAEQAFAAWVAESSTGESAPGDDDEDEVGEATID
jgi:periplasmic divalent cation tolerance protein